MGDANDADAAVVGVTAHTKLAESISPVILTEEEQGGRVTSMVEAIAEAMYQAMEIDSSVFVMGEDIVGGAGLGPPYEGTMGGTFGSTKSLFPAFGSSRVRDTPISEAGIVGAAVGAAAAGLRPIVDIMWASFTALAFDQILNQAAKMRYMSGGQATIPLVIRGSMAGGHGEAAQHSDTLYSLFTHLPGLKVVTPSTPKDAKGLLLTAILDDDDPVLFFEHSSLYFTWGSVPSDDYRIPLGKARILREGGGVTVVGIALMAIRALQVAEELAGEGIEVEVIDPRTLSPLDTETIVSSVQKTGRLVIVDESPPRCNLATDIAAQVAEVAFDALKQPIRRVTAPHSPVPFSPPLESAFTPSAARIASAIRSVAHG